MNITVEKQPNCTATLRVEIPADDANSERNSILSAYASQAKIQGFRPGKAPRKVIEKRFKDEISGELTERLIRKSFDEALKQETLKVLNFGQPSPLSENPDGSMSFETVLTLAPEIELPDYKGVAVKAPSAEVTPEEIDQNLEALRERVADYADIEDRGAETDDIAVIDYTSSLDGKPLEEAVGKPVGHLSGREGYWLKLDDASFLPGFASQLEGSKPGDEKEVSVTIPDDFPIQELQGKEVAFGVNLKELKKMTLPDLDDEFAAKVTGGKTLAELKELISEQAQVEKRRRIDDYKVNQVVEHFNGLVEFELPEELLQHETQNQADELVKKGVSSGMSEEELAAKQEEIFTTAGLQARTNLKTNFILQEIANAENIEISDQELVNHLATIAQSKKEAPKKFIKTLQREGRIPGIRNSMLIGKAIDFILEHATVEEESAEPEASESNE